MLLTTLLDKTTLTNFNKVFFLVTSRASVGKIDKVIREEIETANELYNFLGRVRNAVEEVTGEKFKLSFLFPNFSS